MLTKRFENFLDQVHHTSGDVYIKLYYGWKRTTLSNEPLDFSKATEIGASPKGAFATYKKPGTDKEQQIKPGKLVKLLLPNSTFTDLELEVFTNEFKHFFAEAEEFRVEVIEGDAIHLAYQLDSYPQQGEHSDRDRSKGYNLFSSCMRNKPKEYLELYTENPGLIKMAVVHYKNQGIVGRALLWQLDAQTVLMDRVYNTTNVVRDLMFAWAKEQGYFRKVNQNASSGHYFVDPKSGNNKEACYHTLQLDVLPSQFPYLDSFCYILPKTKQITNKQPGHAEWYYTLQSQSGGFSEHHPEEYVTTWDGREINKRYATYLDSIAGWEESDEVVTLQSGEMYPNDHHDICSAVYMRERTYGVSMIEDRGWFLKSACRIVTGGARDWAVIGHPHFYKLPSGTWTYYSRLDRFALVTSPDEQTTGLFTSLDKPLLAPDTEILVAETGTRFAKGDADYGFYQVVDYFGNERSRGYYPHVQARGRERYIPISEDGQPTTYEPAPVADEEKKKDPAILTSSPSRLEESARFKQLADDWMGYRMPTSMDMGEGSSEASPVRFPMPSYFRGTDAGDRPLTFGYTDGISAIPDATEPYDTGTWQRRMHETGMMFYDSTTMGGPVLTGGTGAADMWRDSYQAEVERIRTAGQNDPAGILQAHTERILNYMNNPEQEPDEDDDEDDELVNDDPEYGPEYDDEDDDDNELLF